MLTLGHEAETRKQETVSPSPSWPTTVFGRISNAWVSTAATIPASLVMLKAFYPSQFGRKDSEDSQKFTAVMWKKETI